MCGKMDKACAVLLYTFDTSATVCDMNVNEKLKIR